MVLHTCSAMSYKTSTVATGFKQIGNALPLKTTL